MFESIISFARAGGNINLSLQTLFPTLTTFYSKDDVTALEQAVIDKNLNAIAALKEFSNDSTIRKAVELAIVSNSLEILSLLCDNTYMFTYKHFLAAVCKGDETMVDLIYNRVAGKIDKQTCIGILSNPKAGKFIGTILPEAKKYLTENNIILHTDKSNIQYLKACNFTFDVDRILGNLIQDIQEHIDDLELVEAMGKIKKYLIIEDAYSQ